ncbi:MAG: hypothetical protein AAB677_03360 [Patescibacteria group bacterium]
MKIRNRHNIFLFAILFLIWSSVLPKPAAAQVIDACVPGAGAAAICLNGLAVPCRGDNICINGKCQTKDTVGWNNFTNFDPKLKTIIFVPGGGEQSPNQIRELYRQSGNKFNFIYFPYDATQKTEVSALALNNLIQKILITYPYQEFKLVGHSLGALVIRMAILRANGYTPQLGQAVKDNELAAVYSRSEFYSVSGLIGGDHYAYNFPPPSWLGLRWSELNSKDPSSLVNWLFSGALVSVFNEKIKGYHSFDSFGDSHLIELDSCRNSGKSIDLANWCYSYQLGKSSDHIKFNLIDESLDSTNHPGFTNTEARAILNGLAVGFGAADKNYCQNKQVAYRFGGTIFKADNPGHLALLAHPTIVTTILADTPTAVPTILITSPLKDGDPVTDFFPLRAIFTVPAGSYIKEAKLYFDGSPNSNKTWTTSGVSQVKSPLAATLKTGTASGSHTLKFVVTDNLGRFAIAERTFTIAADVTPPEIELLFPPLGPVNTDTDVFIRVRAKDQNGISSFNICIDGQCSDFQNAFGGPTACPTTIGSGWVTCYTKIIASQLSDKSKVTKFSATAFDKSPNLNRNVRAWQITTAGVQ